ncbi:MAG: SAM-dependent methyltransferase [Bacteroidia bacterium]|nr:SAM-dependent methyltransferase [Bacteroidia bacterium]MDW8347523.1 N-6 DNA methylase [Bacteroidia bacterium]
MTPLYNDIKLGTFFTPLEWGLWAVRQYNLTQKWLQGATIFDPTCGEGHLFEALIEDALRAGQTKHLLPFENLYGVELNIHLYEKLCQKMYSKYQWKVDSQRITCSDFLFYTAQKEFDIILSNPPWQTFNDLPPSYKPIIKPLFVKYGLVEKTNQILLGKSRIEIAALIVMKSIAKHLKTNGEAVFFIPMSILLNDGANEQFRTYKTLNVDFAITEVYDFLGVTVFEEVKTRYGLIHIQKNQKMKFPIPYYQNEQNEWVRYSAKPIFNFTDPLSKIENQEWMNELNENSKIVLPKQFIPRQGINTCGANDMFIFDDYQEVSQDLVSLSNKKQRNIILPKKFIYPLLVSKNFNSNIHSHEVSKWILLPYQTDGKPLELSQIEQYTELYDYLYFNRPFLAYRRGKMINTWIKRGYFWALLGVGKYNFKRHKVVWEAYGRREFKPKLFTGIWQANQSLQAYISIDEFYEAQQVLIQLCQGKVEKYLQSMNMQGTMNWAQPGRIKKIIEFK